MAPNSLKQMFRDCTGRYGVTGIRYGFTDCDAFGEGFIARDTWTGNLDAPSFMPQGSVVRHGMSLASRDRLAGDYAHPGTCHDGPESPNH